MAHNKLFELATENEERKGKNINRKTSEGRQLLMGRMNYGLGIQQCEESVFERIVIPLKQF